MFQTNQTYNQVIVYVILSLFILIIGAQSSYAQDIEQVVKNKAVQFGGGLSLNTTTYQAWGMEQRRDPFYWVLNANASFNLYGVISVPFSVTLSQQHTKFNYSMPFNQFGMSPRYKAVTLHLGYRAMTLSNYSLGGNLFLGVGLEVMPKESFVRFSMMYGRLAKAVNKVAIDGPTYAQESFRRMGYGFKLGLGRKNNHVDFILFHAVDDVHSLEQDSTSTIRPKENLVIGINTHQKLGQRLTIDVEYAYSFLTRDRNAEEIVIDEYTYVNNMGLFFSPNISSEYNAAFLAKLLFSTELYQLNMSYRKIDPGYESLGVAFLNNDIRDISGGLTFSLWKKKINMGINGGLQKNNLDQQLSASIVRLIYAGNVGVTFNPKLNLNVNYANYSTSTRQEQIQSDVLVDSLSYYQVSSNASLALNYQFSKTQGVKQSVFLNGSYQNADDSYGNTSAFYNAMLSYQLSILSGWSLSCSWNNNLVQNESIDNLNMGPVLSMNKKVLKGKLMMGFSASQFFAYAGKLQKNKVLHLRFNQNLRLGKRQNIQFATLYQNRFEQETQKTTAELRINLNYSIRI